MTNLAITYAPIETIEPRQMVTTANRKAFAAALKTVCLNVGKRNTIPILDYVLLTVKGNILTIEGTDLDVVNRTTLPASDCDGFAACLPAFSLLNLVETSPCDSITFTIKSEAWIEQVEVEKTEYQEAYTWARNHSGQVLIGLGLGNVTMNTLPVAEFPDMAHGFTPETATVFSVSATGLNEAFTKCSIAISTEETRYYLNGIYLHFSAHEFMGLRGLMACATDGHRLALRSIAALVPTSMPGVIVPRKTVAQIIKLTNKSKDQVRITVSQQKIRFTIGDTVILSKLIDGTFLDYQRVIPRNNDKKWEVDTAQMVAAIKQVTSISHEKSQAVKFEFGASEMKLSCNTPDNGCSELAIQARETGLTCEIEIGFNGRYMLDAAKVSGKVIEFHMNDSGSPTLLTDPTDPRGISVLMPLRV